MYAWENVEYGAWMDAEFLKPVESSGEKASVGEGSQRKRAGARHLRGRAIDGIPRHPGVRAVAWVVACDRLRFLNQ